jgi:hypothetical protein
MTAALTKALRKGLQADLIIWQARTHASLLQRTFHAWLLKGEDHWEDGRDTPHADFARAARRGEPLTADDIADH